MAHTQIAGAASEQQQIRILSLDSGGVRCLSSLYILEHVMEAVQKRDSLPEIPKPSDYFDLICGSGSGGLVAILLGRLHMTVNDCIDILSTFSGASKNLFQVGRSQYKSDELRRFMLEVIHRQTKEHLGWEEISWEERELPKEEEIEEDFSEEEPSCRTLVLAMSRNSMLFPVRLRNYNSRMDTSTSDCKIWQAALASIADIDTSEAVVLGNPPMEHCSATFAYANPSKEALDEATRIWQVAAIQVFVNIGAGMSSRPRRILEPSNTLIPPYFRTKSRMQLFAQLATDTEAVAEMVRRDARMLDFSYLRFNVPNVLDVVDARAWQWGPSIIKDLTAQYLQANETKEDIRYCAGRLAKTSPGFELTAGSDAVRVRPLEIHMMVPNIFNSQLRNTRSSLYDTYQCDDQPSDFKSSDNWFNVLSTVTHTFANSGWKENDRMAKIAILDTGYDGRHPKLKDSVRIIAHKSFLTGFPKADKADDDVCGHGTHATALLLKAAPHAKLYVARVAKDYDSDIAVESVVGAINWAVENKVDIITMSFGYPNVNDDIGAAVKKASYENVIIFAAASNGGANNIIDIAFPARMNGFVICVNSTDGKGNPSKYNPPASNARYNFSTLGEAVVSAWPINLDPEGEKRCWGTSTATPIAAAIAALIIGFAQQREVGLDAVHMSRLKTLQGMQQLFLALGTMKNGYCYIAPWKLLRSTGYPKDIVSQIRLEVDKYFGSD